MHQDPARLASILSTLAKLRDDAAAYVFVRDGHSVACVLTVSPHGDVAIRGVGDTFTRVVAEAVNHARIEKDNEDAEKPQILTGYSLAANSLIEKIEFLKAHLHHLPMDARALIFDIEAQVRSEGLMPMLNPGFALVLANMTRIATTVSTATDAVDDILAALERGDAAAAKDYATAAKTALAETFTG